MGRPVVEEVGDVQTITREVPRNRSWMKLAIRRLANDVNKVD